MESQEKKPSYLTPRQMADETGLPAESIRVALRRHELPYLRLGKGAGRGYYVRREAFLAWLDSQETPPAQP
jgi:excisionase family DNA binding protein